MSCRNTVIPEIFRQLIGNLAIGLQTMRLNMKMKNSISDYTKAEFLAFVKQIFNVENTSEDVKNIRLFKKLTEHPDGSDLIYYPRSDRDDSPEGVVKEVKEWRSKQGWLGF